MKVEIFALYIFSRCSRFLKCPRKYVQHENNSNRPFRGNIVKNVNINPREIVNICKFAKNVYTRKYLHSQYQLGLPANPRRNIGFNIGLTTSKYRAHIGQIWGRQQNIWSKKHNFIFKWRSISLTVFYYMGKAFVFKRPFITDTKHFFKNGYFLF